jgi:DNA-binding SARP family transcriptional activator/DNA-binding beta-propeller fold protein YncE
MHANEVVSRDVLLEDLWGERGACGTVHGLEVLVSRLRKCLAATGVQPLETRPSGYELQVGPDELDSVSFARLLQEGRLALGSGAFAEAAETLRQALALWRGRPFEDVTYDSFAKVELKRLEELRLLALEERIEADLALGRHVDVVAELDALVRQHPLRERLRSQLMLALYRSGRQVEALRVYQDARRELVAELGIEPGHAMHQLEQAILRHDPELAVASTPKRAATDAAKARLFQRRRLLLLVLVLGGIAAAIGAVVALLSAGQAGLSGIAPDSVGAISPRSGKVIAETPVGEHPTDLAAANGVWVANFDSGTLSHIEPRTRKVLSVTDAGGTPTGLAVGDGAVWVSNGFAGRVLRVDGRSGRATATIPVGGHPGAIAVDRNGVWVANTITDSVARIDPDVLQPTSVRVGRGPSGIAVGDGSVWVADGLARTLTQIDSASGEVVRARIALRCAPAQVAFGAGSVWVTCTTADAVARVDPRTGQSTATIPVGGGPTQLVIIDDRVWVADTYGRELSEIDPSRNAVVGEVKIGASPEGLASVEGELWVAAGGS